MYYQREKLKENNIKISQCVTCMFVVLLFGVFFCRFVGLSQTPMAKSAWVYKHGTERPLWGYLNLKNKVAEFLPCDGMRRPFVVSIAELTATNNPCPPNEPRRTGPIFGPPLVASAKASKFTLDAAPFTNAKIDRVQFDQILHDHQKTDSLLKIANGHIFYTGHVMQASVVHKIRSAFPELVMPASLHENTKSPT